MILAKDINLAAYHESGRVVFAYLSGYSCDVIELAGADLGQSKTKLNAGADMALVQLILSNTPVTPDSLVNAIAVAYKLMTIYCAGTCATIYFENNLKIPNDLEMDISGQDLAMLQKIQTFLKRVQPNHSDDFPSETIVSVFKRLKEPEIWNAVDLLAKKVTEQDNYLKRFYIEDTLMSAGLTIGKATTKAGFGLGLHEDDEVKPAAQEKKVNSYGTTLTPLDIMVGDFLKKVKSDWNEDELSNATNHLHEIYQKYGV